MDALALRTLVAHEISGLHEEEEGAKDIWFLSWSKEQYRFEFGHVQSHCSE